MLAYKQGSKTITVFKLIITIGGKSSLTILISNKTERSVIIILCATFYHPVSQVLATKYLYKCDNGIGVDVTAFS